MLKWYEKTGKDTDVVLSSRIRLARIFRNYKFHDFLEKDQANEMITAVANCVLENNPDQYQLLWMKDCKEDKRNALKEKRRSARLWQRKMAERYCCPRMKEHP